MQRNDLAPLLGDTAPAAAFAASYNPLSILGALLNRGTPSWWVGPGLNAPLGEVYLNYDFKCCHKKMASHFLREVALRLPRWK